MKLCPLYIAVCRRLMPGGLTISAWAWKKELETGGTRWLRKRIDKWFLDHKGQERHCETQYRLESGYGK